MSKLIIKQYCNQSITFDPTNEMFINLTEMAKPFGKKPSHFLELDQTKTFLAALSTVGQNGTETKQYIKTINGGISPGTWAHRKVAIKFAAWLDPRFEVWMINQIDEVLLGNTNKPSYMIDDSIERAKIWILEEQERRNLLAVNSALMHVSKTYTTGEVAKELGFTSARKLNRLLHDKGIQFYQNGTWIPYAKYADIGLVEIKQDIAKNGHVYYDRRWTQKGRAFIVALFEDGRAA